MMCRRDCVLTWSTESRFPTGFEIEQVYCIVSDKSRFELYSECVLIKC